jgi:TonB family protein
MLIRYAFLIFCLLQNFLVIAQNNPASGDSSKIYTYVPQMPEPGYDIGAYVFERFRCGDSALMSNSTIITRFVVNEDGKISDCTVVKSAGSHCDEDVVKIINSMPPWKPGKKDKKAVKAYFTLPVHVEVTMKEPGTTVKEILSGKDEKKVKACSEKQVDEKPFPKYDYKQYLAKNVHYPEIATAYGVEGRVIVKFVVNEDGSISNAHIAMGAGGGGLDKEALRVVSNSPPWQPGKLNGQPVKVWMKVPIDFKMNRDASHPR